MAKIIEYSDIVKSQPVWMGDEAAFPNYMPGGAIVKASSLAGTDRRLFSGNMLARVMGDHLWYYLPSNTAKSGGNFTTKKTTTLKEAAVTGATSVSVVNSDGFYATNAITVNGESKVIASVDSVTDTIVLTTGLAGDAAAGATFELTTAVAFNEFFLLATDIHNIDRLAECTLYRQQRLVYQDRLPGWATASADWKTLIQSLYHCIYTVA